MERDPACSDPTCSYRAEHHRIAELEAERNHLAALLRDWLARDELGGSWPYLKRDSRAALNETQEDEPLLPHRLLVANSRYREALERIAELSGGGEYAAEIARQALSDPEPPTDEQERP